MSILDFNPKKELKGLKKYFLFFVCKTLCNPEKHFQKYLCSYNLVCVCVVLYAGIMGPKRKSQGHCLNNCKISNNNIGCERLTTDVI